MLNLKKYRESKGLSQAAVARDLNISRQTYNNYELGKREADYETLLKFAEYFNISVDLLLRDDNIKIVDDNDNIVVYDDETRDLIDSLRSRPEMKILFSVSKKATKEDILKAVKIIEALKGDE